MKKLLLILILSALYLTTASPQDRIHREVIPEKATNEKLLEIQKSNAFGLQGLNDIESLLLKSKSSNWQTALRNPQRKFYDEEGFNAKDTRTNINKTLLGNGFLLIEEIYQTWDSSAWVNSSKGSYTYDGNNNLTEALIQYWDGSAWVNSFKQSYIYDGNNNPAEYLLQTWDGSAWVNYYKGSYIFDGNNNLTELFYQTWDGSAWVNSSKYSYTYNGNNNLTEYFYQTWDGSAWVNNYKYSYTYDGNNNLTEDLYQTWDGVSWVNSSKSSYIYDGNNNQTELLIQYWDGSAWANNYKYSYTYDGNNNQTEALMQLWNSFAWVNISKDSYTYDGNNNKIEALRQNWDGSAWVNSSQNSYVYIPVTAVNEDLSSVYSYNLSNNYPNPFNPSTKISWQLPVRGQVLLKVYDVLGNEVATLINEEKPAGIYEVIFDASDLASGVYFYRLQTNGFTQTKKMILMK